MSIRSFEEGLGEGSLNKQLVYAVNQIIDAARQQAISEQQMQLLADTLVDSYPAYFRAAGVVSRGSGSRTDPGYGANFDLAEEVNEQIKAVRALRDMIMDENGQIKDGHTPRDAKELISSSNTLLGSLMRFHDKIINQNRMRLVEQATVEAVKTLPEEQQEVFFETLQKGLDKVD